MYTYTDLTPAVWNALFLWHYFQKMKKIFPEDRKLSSVLQKPVFALQERHKFLLLGAFKVSLCSELSILQQYTYQHNLQ